MQIGRAGPFLHVQGLTQKETSIVTTQCHDDPILTTAAHTWLASNLMLIAYNTLFPVCIADVFLVAYFV